MRNFILLVFLILSGAVKAQDEYAIKGKIRNMEDGTCIVLYRWEGNVGEMIATDTVRGGKFTFSGKLKEMPVRMTIGMSDDTIFYGKRTLWIGKQVTEVKGKSKCLDLWKVKSGVKQQQEENELVKIARPYIASSGKIRHEKSKEYKAELQDKHLKHPLMKDYPVNRILDSLDVLQSEQVLEFLEKQEELTEVGMEWLYPMAYKLRYSPSPRFDRERIVAVFSKLDTLQKNSVRAAEFHSCLYRVKEVEIGDQMVDGTLFDLQGNEHRLSDYAGKYILLDFWSSACGPCLAARPEMEEMATAYRDKVHIISICLDTRKEWWEKSSEGLKGINLSDLKGEGGIVAHYGTKGMPLFVIVNPEGRIADKWYGYGKGIIRSRLARQLKQDKGGDKRTL